MRTMGGRSGDALHRGYFSLASFASCSIMAQYEAR